MWGIERNVLAAESPTSKHVLNCDEAYYFNDRKKKMCVKKVSMYEELPTMRDKLWLP